MFVSAGSISRGQVSIVLKKQWVKPAIDVFKYANPERLSEEPCSDADALRLRLEQLTRPAQQSDAGKRKLNAA
jgi:hypothetical protein